MDVFPLIFGLVSPYLAKIVIDEAYGNKDLRLFIVLIGLGGLGFVASGAASALARYLSKLVLARVVFDLNLKVFDKMRRLPYAFFCNRSTGEHLYKMGFDIEAVSRFLVDSLPQTLFLLPRAFVILGIVFWINWKMGLWVLLLVPFLYGVPLYVAARMKVRFRQWVEVSQSVFGKLFEVFTHVEMVKSFGRENAEKHNYIRGLIRKIRLGLVTSRYEVGGAFANSLVSRAVLGGLVFYGGCQVIHGKMTLGDLSAITLYLGQFAGLQGQLAMFFQQSSMAMVSCERLEKVLQAPAEPPEDRDAQAVELPEGRIEFLGVTFGYEPEREVLKNLSLEIAGGASVALTGFSGCGKTTLVKLLLRLYRPGGGEIRLDGHRMEAIRSGSFYEQVGVVLEEPFLWNDTAENNIRYGRESATPEEIREAARVACAEEFIERLPQGYATVIGENACKISEGQKQRIAVARAVIKRPKILILDEPLSSVDGEVEGRIIANLRRFLAGTTIIIVSHRISTIKKADAVCFLAGPGEARTGRHEEFVREDPQYRRYLSHQLE